MRVIVVGLGVQGEKRRRFAGPDYVASVDPDPSRKADYRSLHDAPLDTYDAALLCVPDQPKIELLTYLASNSKHALVEKPLWAPSEKEIEKLEGIFRRNRAVCYTAYNHRFEPHFVRMRDLLASGTLGHVYRCRMFYGNGTARLVRDSEWRDREAGVVPDLGSHLLDTVRFWFGDIGGAFEVASADRFENRAPDHAVFVSQETHPRIELEMTLLMWRNHFTCDILAEKGSAHIASLCKWGPTTFTKRERTLPSGRPIEEVEVLEQPDPTWALEYAHFTSLCSRSAYTDLTGDMWLNQTLRRLGADAIAIARAGG